MHYRGMRRCRVPLFLTLLIASAGPGPTSLAAHAHSAPKAMGAPAASATGALATQIRDQAKGPLKQFYAERAYKPLWVRSGRIGAQATTLLGYLSSADLDGLKPSDYRIDDLRDHIAGVRGGDPAMLARAEVALSNALARYVRDQRRSSGVRMIYADSSLRPKQPAVEAVLRAASFPKSFDAYLTNMQWMSPHYVRLRKLVGHAEKIGVSREEMKRLHLNLDRARILPGPWTHHVVVDSSSGQLWYYGSGKQVGTMRVVVGAVETQTPMMVGKLQWAILNPYWNVPDYLARDSIAKKVLGGRTLASLRMEALSDWGASPRKLAASEIDWPAVASGRKVLRLRELPGGANSMGRVKFLFPNKEGIYLHDTPERALLTKPDRHFSNGCIRLEKAAELGRWLLQRPVSTKSKAPEQAVPLPAQVPVYLTYLTAVPTARGVGFRKDVYGRDD